MQYAPAIHWDQVFRTYRQRGEDLDWGEQWTGAFAPILHTCHVQHLLDLGCGTGNDVLRLTPHGYTVVGLDHSREAVQQAATKAASRAAFLVADMAAPLPLADACFDAVMSNVAMHFFDDARTRALFARHAVLCGPRVCFCSMSMPWKTGHSGLNANHPCAKSRPITFWRQMGKPCIFSPPRICVNC
jgi:SAM-dependent methyltransferase